MHKLKKMNFMILINKLKILCIVVFYCSLYPPIMVVCLITEQLSLESTLRKCFVNFLKSYWSEITFTFFSFYLQKKITIIYNKKFLKKRKSLVISNHISNFDWILLIKIFHYFKKFNELSIILKKELQNLPVVGRGMMIFDYIFLKRDINLDKEVLEKNMRKLKLKKAYNLLLFPEGTIFCENTHKLSKKYEKSKNLDFSFDYVLIPRKTGFNLIIESIYDDIDDVTDITIFHEPKIKYVHDTLTVENVFYQRNIVPNCLFLIDLYDKSEEMKEPNYIFKIFERKNLLLKNYLTNDSDFVNFLIKENVFNKNYEIIEINFCTFFTYLVYFFVLTSLCIMFYYFVNFFVNKT